MRSISVIIPTYNREKTITKAIESVLNQTYPVQEVIVVDNGSKNHTEEVVGWIGDERIRYILKHQRIRGPGQLETMA